MRKLILHSLAATAYVALTATSAHAASTSNTFGVQITIQASCDVATTAPTTLNFGTAGPLATNVDQTSTITVTCSSTTPYTIALDNGLHAVSGTKYMQRTVGGTDTIAYELYTDASHTTAWSGVTVVSDTGSGNAKTYTVYGRVPAQTTPPPANYADTVTVTVSY